jgi:hypothetical protein
MEDCLWKIVCGRLSMEDCLWKIVYGRLSVEDYLKSLAEPCQ